MPKFFVDGLAAGAVFQPSTELAHHLRVLRVRPGETVLLCDENGLDYPCTALEGGLLQTGDPAPCNTEPALRVTLFQGLPKTGKMDIIIQKAVELGAHAVVPVQMMRSVARPGKADNKTQRYQKIALSAAEQSMRGLVPRVWPVVMRFEEAVAQSAGSLNIAADLAEARPLRACLSGREEAVGLWIGPEGGFAPQEIEAMREAGFTFAGLGPRVLRTETAGPAALACLLL